MRLKENEKRGNKNGFVVGEAMPVADLKLYYSVAFMTSGNLDHIDPPAVVKDCARIQAFVEKMKEDENIKKFDEAFAAQQKVFKEDANNNVFTIKGKGAYASYGSRTSTVLWEQEMEEMKAENIRMSQLHKDNEEYH